MARHVFIWILLEVVVFVLSGRAVYGQPRRTTTLSEFENKAYRSLGVKQVIIEEMHGGLKRKIDKKEFDAWGFLLSQDSCSYDLQGKVRKRLLKTIRYDSLHRDVLVSVIDSLDPEIDVDSSRKRLVFDKNGLLQFQESWDSRRDMEKVTTRYTYDMAGNLTGYVIDAKGVTTPTEIKLRLGDQGQILEQALSGVENAVHQYVYDAEGRLVAQLDSNKCMFKWIYDNHGKLVQKLSGCCEPMGRDARCHGLTEDFHYDSKGRLQSYERNQAYVDGGRVGLFTVFERFEYQPNGLLSKRCGITADSCLEYSYQFYQKRGRR
jgi:YD repeat-containing protein